MSIKSLIAPVVFFGTLSAMAPAASAASSFYFQFYNNSDTSGLIGSPLVGSGIFTSPTNLMPGSYTLSDFNGYGFSFTFGSTSYSTADLSTPDNEVNLVISSITNGMRLTFVDVGSKSNGGSIDFRNDLSFSPSQYSDSNYFERTQGDFGTYLATTIAPGSVPETATWAMLLTGMGGIGFAMRRRQNVSVSHA